MTSNLRLAPVAGLILLASCTAETPMDAGTPPLETGTDSCTPQALLGMPAPVAPAWCTDLGSGPATATTSENHWSDDFDHGLSFASLGDGYQVFDRPPASSAECSVAHFRHNEHWMVDVGVNGCAGALMRPDAAFRFEDGKLMVEATVAAGIESYGGNVWPEIVITTAPEPTSPHSGDLYAYTMFDGYWSFGCRLQSGRVPICALFNDQGTSIDNRVFEISFFQHDGMERFGGGPFSPATDAAWRVCADEDPDVQCRDHFRLELERDRVRLDVNGVRYMEHFDIPAHLQFPDAFLDGEVYVYFASWVWRLGEVAPGARFHWDDLAVNP